MSKLEQALALAKQGFYVFPVEANGKLPTIKDFPNRATRDIDQIRKWFSVERNIGISTSRFDNNKSLLVVDIDNKNGKDGDGSIFELELSGHEFPTSLEQATPSGGRHIIYVTDEPVRQGVDVLGHGLDIRAKGGYILGMGSTLPNGKYQQINGHNELAQAPSWLVDKLGRAPERKQIEVDLKGVDPTRAINRALKYLETAPLANEGEAGDLTTFKVAAKLKDLGCTAEQAFDLMDSHWNDRCAPPWDLAELEDKVFHAFKYGKEQPGISAPEAVFPAIEIAEAPGKLSPMDGMNTAYAYVLSGGGGHVLKETTDQNGNFDLQHLSVNAFHGFYANRVISTGKKTEPLSKAWMEWPSRRTYEGLVFEPSGCNDQRFYNMWRGFSVEPADTGKHWAVDMWLDHALTNVCGGDTKLCHWLVSWFAHLIQKPSEKPMVATVFKGPKGVGKNALIERVGDLIGNHFFLTSNRRYLLSNFTGHLEKCLMFVLDEAFWSGDKQAEGIIKDLITGTNHVIEHKGKEPYAVRNLTRIAIIGNEDWVVPATSDERRWAVFDVGSARRQDRDFFGRMRKGLDDGGNRHLLRYLLDYKLGDINAAPDTKGLLAQKHASLEPFEQWWLDCLSSGCVAGSDLGNTWPTEISTERFRSAFTRYVRERNIRSRIPDARAVGHNLARFAPKVVRKKARRDEGLCYLYLFPELDGARQDWEAFIGSKVEWEQ